MDEPSPIAITLAQVGPRLRRIRTERGLTLSALAEATGISISTLSRLESGRRRASLEMLLPIAQAHRLPLDELLGTLESGKSRMHTRPRVRHGRVHFSLTNRPSPLQAWKLVIPAAQNRPEPCTHEGHVWLYVLSGRVRVVLGDRELVLEPGEAVEFDTGVPHWFGPLGGSAVEVLGLLGGRGERVHVRTGLRSR
ncbi:helix-turn-helix domain-containing protein [Streptomyces sp. SID5474]|nr:XRE family transcriptional regulator [Embleya scabrispora]MYS86733.1 helix-turn-helix domain-containing protein [Streptomyces sp. SID5474]